MFLLYICPPLFPFCTSVPTASMVLALFRLIFSSFHCEMRRDGMAAGDHASLSRLMLQCLPSDVVGLPSHWLVGEVHIERVEAASPAYTRLWGS